MDSKVRFDEEFSDQWSEGLKEARASLPDRIEVDPEKVQNGLAKLVLTLVELIRRLLEHQAIRRIEGGSLTDEEIERLGLAFLDLEAKMDEMKKVFGLEGEELNLNLGPLGDLM